jgi:hypothetical protein
VCIDAFDFSSVPPPLVVSAPHCPSDVRRNSSDFRQVLLDPLEEQLHTPLLPVNVGHRLCRYFEMVRSKHQLLLPFFVDIAPGNPFATVLPG